MTSPRGDVPRAVLRVASAVSLVIAATSCAALDEPSDVATPGVVAALDAWQPVDAARDPFVSHRPAAVDCPSFGFRREGEFFEVETGSCNYATFEQPQLRAISADADLTFALWHLALWGPDGATAHVAVQIGDDLLWERELPLPAQEQFYQVSVPAPRGYPAGESVFFHVHNHGSNSYRLSVIAME